MNLSADNLSADESIRVLVVEDEPQLAAVLCDYLKASGYETCHLADGEAVLDTFTRWQPGLVLLDLMLPGADGVSLCRELRAHSDVPVIMVTARVDEVDRLLGLSVGADDYICKPFSPREVVARVGTVLRRYRRHGGSGAAGADAAQPVSGGMAVSAHAGEAGIRQTLGGAGTAQATGMPEAGMPGTAPAGSGVPGSLPGKSLYVDVPGCRAALHGRWLDLTPVEFRLLRTLAGSPGRAWSRSQLMDHLYEDDRVVTDRTVDSHVKNLRRKLAEAGAGEDPITSIYGVGYRFELG